MVNRMQVKAVTQWLLGLSFLLCLSACDDDALAPIAEPRTGALLAVAGMQSLRCLELNEEQWLSGSLGLGYAANWLGVRSDELFVLHSLSSELLVFARDSSGVRVVRSVDLGLESGLNPYFASWRSDGHLLVSNLLAGSISLVDVDTGARNSFPCGVAPAGLQVIDDRVYTICSGYDFAHYAYGTGQLLVQDATSGARLDSLQLGLNPQFLLLDRAGKLQISVTGDYTSPGYMLRVDPAHLESCDTLQVATSPGRLSVDAENRIWVAAGGWLNQGEEEGLLLSYDGSTMSDLRYTSLPHGVLDVVCDTVSSHAPRVFAACMDAMQLAELRGDRLFATYSLQDPPQALGLWP